MASQESHIALANRNHEFLLKLLADGAHPDWAATVAFYKAVHIVEAVFFNDVPGKHSTSHSDRERTLKTSRYSHIYKDYAHLLNASRIARYLESNGVGEYKSFADFMDLSAVNKLVAQRLYGVEQKAIAFLSDDGKKQLSKIAS